MDRQKAGVSSKPPSLVKRPAPAATAAAPAKKTKLDFAVDLAISGLNHSAQEFKLFSLQQQGCSNEDLNKVIQAFSKNTTVKSMNVSFSQLNDENFALLLQRLKNHPSITKIMTEQEQWPDHSDRLVKLKEALESNDRIIECSGSEDLQKNLSGVLRRNRIIYDIYTQNHYSVVRLEKLPRADRYKQQIIAVLKTASVARVILNIALSESDVLAILTAIAMPGLTCIEFKSEAVVRLTPALVSAIKVFLGRCKDLTEINFNFNVDQYEVEFQSILSGLNPESLRSVFFKGHSLLMLSETKKDSACQNRLTLKTSEVSVVKVVCQFLLLHKLHVENSDFSSFPPSVINELKLKEMLEANRHITRFSYPVSCPDDFKRSVESVLLRNRLIRDISVVHSSDVVSFERLPAEDQYKKDIIAVLNKKKVVNIVLNVGLLEADVLAILLALQGSKLTKVELMGGGVPLSSALASAIKNFLRTQLALTEIKFNVSGQQDEASISEILSGLAGRYVHAVHFQDHSLFTMCEPIGNEKEAYRGRVVVYSNEQIVLKGLAVFLKGGLPIATCDFTKMNLVQITGVLATICQVPSLPIRRLYFPGLSGQLVLYKNLAEFISHLHGLTELSVIGKKKTRYHSALDREIEIEATEGIACEELKLLASALERTKAISKLDLSCNLIAGTGCIALAKFIESTNTLNSLNLSYNTLGGSSLLSMANALTRNKSVQIFYCEQFVIAGEPVLTKDDMVTFCKNFSGSALNDFKYTKNKEVVSQSYGRVYTDTKPVYNRRDDGIESLEKKLNKNKENKNSIIIAVHQDNLVDFEKYLNFGVSLYACDDDRNPLLHIAIKQSATKIVKALICRHYNLLVCDSNGFSALEYARHIGASAEILALLENPVALVAVAAPPAVIPPKSQATAKTTPGKEARKSGPMDRFMAPRVVLPMPAAAASPPAEEQPVTQGSPALHSIVAAAVSTLAVDDRIKKFWFAIQRGDAAVCVDFYVEGFDAAMVNRFGQTTVIIAVRSPDVGIFKSVIDMAEPPSLLQHKDNRGQSLFHHVCQQPLVGNALEKLKIILSKTTEGINDLDHDGCSPLYYLASQQPVDQSSSVIAADMALLMLRAGADPLQAICDLMLDISKTPLLQAAATGSSRFVVMCLRYLADQRESINDILEQTDGLGNGLIHYAVMNRDEVLTRQLCVYGVVLDRPNLSGKTALSLAGDMPLREFKGELASRLVTAGSFWSKNLNLYYGCKAGKNKKVELPGKDVHQALKNAAEAHPDGKFGGKNIVVARLTFIVSAKPHQRGGDHGRDKFEIELCLDHDVHQSHFWSVNRGVFAENGHDPSRQELEKIVGRFQAAPDSVKEKAVDEIDRAPQQALSEVGIRQSYDDRKFAINFHHGEMGLLAWLEESENIKFIVEQLAQKYKESGYKVYAVVLDAYSKYYVCANCQVSVLGVQNPFSSKFISGLTEALIGRQFKVPRLGLTMASRFSAGWKWQMPEKTIDDHEELTIDLRMRPWRMMLLQDAKAVQPVTTGAFSSRAK